MSQVRTAELVALVYFSYLPLAARLAGRRLRPGWADAVSLGLAGASAALQLLGTGPVASLVRDWAPGAFLLLSYWMSAPYKGDAAPAFERWLIDFDRRVLGTALDRFTRRAPRLLLESLELAYLTCYPFVPAGLLWLVLSGEHVDADRFWTAVLAASLPCYALLPWFHTAPPRAVEPDLAIERRGLAVRRFNSRLLHRTSVQANTFPSGHVAATVAVALMVAATSHPVAGLAFGAGAVAIAIATVVGRYHFGADAVLGALLGLAGFWLAG